MAALFSKITFFIILFTTFFSTSKAAIQVSAFGEGLYFLSPDYEATDSKTFLFAGVKLISKKDPNFEDAFKINMTTIFASKSVLNYVNFRELYFDISVGEKSRLSIGRKLHNWSSLDTVWNLGVYQPVFKWNALRPENQGLTGLFFNQEGDGWGVTLYASPLFIPNQGAGYELKDGQFQSGNPWFQSPPQNLKFQSQLLPIDYNIHRPEIKDVVLQTLYGGQFRMISSNGLFGQIAAAHKPSNELALGYQGVLVTTRVKIDITPKVYTEDIFSADLGIKDQWGFAQISALYTNPKSPEFDATFNKPVFKAATLYGPQFLYKLNIVDLYFGYFNTSGGEITDEGPDASADRASLSQRFLYSESALVRAYYNTVILDDVKYSTSLEYKFGPKDGYRVITFKNNFNLKGPWAFWLDLLLVDTDSSKQTNIESYKSRDQAWLGTSYDF